MQVPSMSPARRALLQDIADRVPDLAPNGVRVGIDGVGKTVFADHLAAVLSTVGRTVIRISADHFHHPRASRYRRGRDSPEGFWLDSYDYSALHRGALDPFGPGGSRRYRSASHDLVNDQPVESPVESAPPGTVLVLDWLFLHRDELAGIWDLSVFLQAPLTVSVARAAARDGSHPDPSHPTVARYVGGQRLYFDACSPWERASLVVDATNLDVPTLRPAR